MRTKWDLGLAGGLVVANPIPQEAAIPAEEIGRHIAQALSEATSKGVQGKEVTPFLLARIEALSGGSSLEANVALVRSNAGLAAEIAVAYAALS